MSEGMERTRKALGEAVACLHRLSTLGGTSSVGNEMAREGLAKVESLLNPLPEFEEVEESAGWVNIYADQHSSSGYAMGQSRAYATEQDANENSGKDRIGCQELRVKVKRPVKKKVVRDVEFPCNIAHHTGGIRASFNIFVSGNNSEEHAALRDSLDGKTGTLIFRWEE